MGCRKTLLCASSRNETACALLLASRSLLTIRYSMWILASCPQHSRLYSPPKCSRAPTGSLSWTLRAWTRRRSGRSTFSSRGSSPTPPPPPPPPPGAGGRRRTMTTTRKSRRGTWMMNQTTTSLPASPRCNIRSVRKGPPLLFLWWLQFRPQFISQIPNNLCILESVGRTVCAWKCGRARQFTPGLLGVRGVRPPPETS